MIGGLFACISAFFSRHRDLALENLALRQQLAVFKRRHPRPKLRPADRLFRVWLSTVWAGWRETLTIVKPETVITRHRQAFRFYWRWLSRPKSHGRPAVAAEVRTLIKQMAQANPLWGAPRIHGELQKLGLEISDHRRQIVYFNVTANPTAAWTAQQMVEPFSEESAPRYLIRDHDQIYEAEFRQRVQGMGIEEVITAARSPWQNPFAERVIGSLR